MVRVHAVGPGDSIGSILGAAGVGGADVAALVAEAERLHDLSRIKVGKEVLLTFDPTGSTLLCLRYPLDPERDLVVEREGQGFAARQEVTPFEDEVVGISGVVDDTLWDSARSAGLPPDMVSTLAGIFDWQIDFNTEVRPGDSFRLLVARRTVLGAGSRIVGLAAAEFVNAGRVHRALRFDDAEGGTAWYTPSGERMARAFLKSPLAYSHVGSGFNLKRFHPILKSTRPHWGQDYGAPTGAPVRAVASGTVQFVGTRGGFGKHVRLVHSDRFGSSYSHLSRYAPGLKPGRRIAQGTVVGYVGSTGLSTGPHLHFEFYDRGRPVDYAKVEVPRGESIEGMRRPAFDGLRDQVLPRLLAVDGATRVAAVLAHEGGAGRHGGFVR